MHAVQLANSIIGTAGLQTGELRPAALIDAVTKEEVSCSGQQEATPAAVKEPFKKGFLDAKPRGSSKVRRVRSCFRAVKL